MGYYISAATGGYYEGDRAHALDTEVPQRPDHRATWDGEQWQLDPGKIEREEAQEKIAELEAQQTPRLLRSAALGDAYALAQLALIEDQIAALGVRKA